MRWCHARHLHVQVKATRNAPLEHGAAMYRREMPDESSGVPSCGVHWMRCPTRTRLSGAHHRGACTPVSAPTRSPISPTSRRTGKPPTLPPSMAALDCIPCESHVASSRRAWPWAAPSCTAMLRGPAALLLWGSGPRPHRPPALRTSPPRRWLPLPWPPAVLRPPSGDECYLWNYRRSVSHDVTHSWHQSEERAADALPSPHTRFAAPPSRPLPPSGWQRRLELALQIRGPQ